MAKKKGGEFKKYSMELIGSFNEGEVTEETTQKYGYSLKDLDQHGYKLIEWELMFLDEPCDPLVVGSLKKAGIKGFKFDSEKASEFLASLKNKPVHINSFYNGHWDLDENDERAFKTVGSILGGRVDLNPAGKKVVKCLGGLYDQSYPKETEYIHNNKQSLGASFEMTPLELDIDESSMIATVKNYIFKGAAILKKHLAAFPETSLLVAQSADIETDDLKDKKERSTKMELTQEQLDELLAKAVSDAKDVWTKEQTESAEAIAKEAELVALKASVTEKDKTIGNLTAEKTKMEAEKKDNELLAQATEWFDKNKDSYEEKDKTTVIEARTSILKGTPTTEQIDSLIAMRKVPKKEERASDLYAGKPDEKSLGDIDAKHGIRIRK